MNCCLLLQHIADGYNISDILIGSDEEGKLTKAGMNKQKTRQNKKQGSCSAKNSSLHTHFVAFDCDFFPSSLSFSFLAFFISRGMMSSKGE